MHVCVPHENIRFLETVIADNSELLCGLWEQKLVHARVGCALSSL